jgi:predicted Zn-dependent protease
MRRTLLPLLLAPLLLGGCGSHILNPVSGQTERSVMSEESELAEGQKAHQQVLQEYGVVQDPRLQAYVNKLGQRLAKLSHRDQLQWHFTLLDSPEINAFALPGGYVYVTRGILAYMGSEADLAGVIGHEIGHVTARHGAQRATRQQDAGLGLLAASVLGAVLESQGIAGAGQAVNQVSQTVASGYIASYGREQELQADGLGAEYLARSAYDPRIMINVIKVLKDQERFAADQARAEGRPAPAPSSWLASHPSNDQRLQTITELADQYPAKSKNSYADEGRARYLQAVSGMDFGDSAAQGVTRGRNFYHAALGIAITAPPGWKIQNEAAQLTLVNTARDAALVMKTVPPQAGKTHDEILRTLLRPSQGSSERLTLNGLSATHFMGARTNAQGQSQALEATLVSGPANALYLLNYSARDAAALQRARSQLQEAQNSFRPLNATERSAARAWTIKTAPYPRGGFAELARHSPLDSAESQLRLINGFYGGGEPKPGQLVKIIATP